MNRIIFRRNILRNRRIPRIILNRTNPLEVYNDVDFRRRYRLNKETFIYICNEILGDEIQDKRGLPIQPIQQLTITVRYYATGSFQIVIGDLEDMKVNQSTVCRIIKAVSIKIAENRHTFIKFPIPEEIESIKQKFYAMARFPGCIGCIDGCHIPIKNPGGENSEIFRNRKGYFSINCQAIAGPNKEIFSACIQWPGSVHDSRVFENSVIKTVLEGRQYNFHIIGDSAYPCRCYLLTPFRNPITLGQKRYNYSLSSTRMTVECCFGILKRRFACLNTPIRTKLDTCIAIITSCFVLHNVAIMLNDKWNDYELEDNANVLVEFPRNHAGEVKRNEIVDLYFN